VDYFRRGLPMDLLISIIKGGTIPDTIDEWESAAREEVKRRRLIETYFPGPEGGDADTVQIGVIRRLHLSEEDKARLMREGRCFICKEIGHRARDCSDKLDEENVRN